MKNKENVLENLGVTIFLRDGKYHWMIKSCSFETPEQALRDALHAFSIPLEGVTFRTPGSSECGVLKKT